MDKDKMKRIMGTAFRKIKRLTGCLLNHLIPKNDQYILIHTSLGYRDNVKAIGDYLFERGLSNKYTVFCDLPNENDIPLVPRSFSVITSKLRAYSAFFRSKYVFYAFGQISVKPARGQVVINMWHGTPLKKIGNLETENKQDRFFFTHVLAASELYRPVFAEAFACPTDNVYVCGHPRNDVLFRDNPWPECVCKTRYILWTPTFRKSSLLNIDNGELQNTVPLFSFEQLDSLNCYLKKKEIHMIVKRHPIEDVDESVQMDFSNLHIFTHRQFVAKGYELYAVASNAMALVTDYSSMAFDYMLLDRPIGYTVNDLNEYQNKRGLIFDNPFDFMPGEKIGNPEQFFGFIDHCIRKVDPYSDKRKRVNDIVNQYKDGENCKRVLRLAGIIE